jgi:hypothetical protein
VENFLFTVLLSRSKDRLKSVHIRYEDLAGSPVETFNLIGDWLGLDFSSTDFSEFRDVENHGVSGNPTRWRNSKIVLDENWRDSLPGVSQRIAWWMNSIPARVLGYQK